MKPSTYHEMAETLGLFVCEACTQFSPRQHRMGIQRFSVIHWSERRVTKPGMRNFLILAAQARYPSTMPPWERIWRSNADAYRIARRTFHTLLPAHLSREDREAAAADVWHHGGRIPRAAYAWITGGSL